ncbi:DUF1330 domain-containing protein [Tardiphaga sp. 215_C5_N2_1]|uniref:DUF1330 domain-containing protein n=1 Tax=Tardiphaga sp. 215_C5_N2_1 TaxID=3240774 RepID=UPI003F8C0F2E
MPAYVVNEITITDIGRYREYAERMPDTLTPFGGIFLARGAPESMAGELPSQRIVILSFPDIERARLWRDSDAYQSLLLIRNAASTSRVYVVAGDNLDKFVN